MDDCRLGDRRRGPFGAYRSRLPRASSELLTYGGVDHSAVLAEPVLRRRRQHHTAAVPFSGAGGDHSGSSGTGRLWRVLRPERHD